MLNKNVADYTNFDGKTNKKIVQAPGGASSFSLAWSEEKTDYGHQRNNRNQRREETYAQQPQYHQKSVPSYNEYSSPIRVMDLNNYQGYQQPQYSQPQKYPISYPYPQGSQHNYNSNYGGEQGYQNYKQQNSQQSPYGNYNRQIDQIDIAMQQHEMSRPPPIPRQSLGQQQTQGKPSIKINGPPRQNLIIGNDYNYWKDDGKEESRGSRRQYSREYPKQESQPTFGQRVPPQQYTTQKTSIKMHHPPGGRQNFTLG